ncbi:MAG: murein biosynthesis integral membrane protein MurJ [Anaerolineales bacterium]|nr:MAG: murein biosynthesis integral membrane protein MurJ [Anaerolineales bacterium]
METSTKKSDKTNSANRQIARAAGVVMAGFVLSNLVGLVRRALEARVFGTSAVYDAFNAADRLPDILFMLVAGGALASAFIPTFTEFLEKDDRNGAWRLASSIVNLVVLILTLFSAACWVLAPQIVANILAPDFSPEQQALTVELLRILLLTPVIFGVSGLVMGVLNTHQSFLVPALAPTMLWSGMIVGVLFIVPQMGIHGLAWGKVLGAGMHFAIQVPGLLKLPKRKYVPTLGLKIPSVREVGRLMAPRLLGVSVVQLNFLVNTIIASGLPEGSLTSINVAFAVMTMPQVVIAQAISIAALPTFSAQIARGKPDEMRRSLALTIRGILFLSLPAMMGLILLRTPVVSMLFQRGEFGAHSVELTTWALLWYTVGLVGHSLVEIVSRAFYALHDTKTPVLVGMAAMTLNVVFSLTFPGIFERYGWMPHGGLALANSLATSLEMVVLLWLMNRRLRGLEGHHVLTGTVKSLLATVGMSAGLAWWVGVVVGQSVWLISLGGIALGGVVYGVLMWVLQVEEVRGIVASVKVRRS